MAKKYSELKESTKVKLRARNREWKQRNVEHLRQKRKERYEANKTKERELNNQWKKANPDKYIATKKESGRKYREKNADKIRDYKSANRARINTQVMEKYYSNDEFAIASRIRASINQALRFADTKKTVTTFELLGLPIQEFKLYIESLFLPGMSWENRSEWHIDHNRPCASFDLTDKAQQRECFHYTNVKPMWKKDNIQKSSIYNGKRHRYKKSERNADDISMGTTKYFLQ